MMAATWQQQGLGPTSHHHQHHHHPSSNTVVVAPDTNLHAANTTPMQAGAAPSAGGAVLLSPQGSAIEDDTSSVPITSGTGKLSLQDEKQIALSQLEELENAIATRKVTKIDGRKTRWKEYHEEKQRQQELTGTPLNKRRSRKKISTNSTIASENSENEEVVNNNNINKSPVNNKAADTAAVSMKMDVLNTSNSNHSHAATSPLGSVVTSNVLESMKQQFLQGTENVPEIVINGKLGIDEKDKNKRNSRSRRVAGKSPKGNKKVITDENTTQVIIPQVGPPVPAKAPETPTSPITPADNLTPIAVIQRKFFPPQSNSLTKGLRGIRKTDESPTKSDPRSPIASPLLPPVVTPFSLPIINSTEGPSEPVTPLLTPISLDNKLEESIGKLNSTTLLRDLTEKVKDFTKNASNKETTPKIIRTSTPRGATKDTPKSTKFSLLDESTDSPAIPVTPMVAPLVGENNHEESIGEITTSSKEEATQKRGRGRPALPEHVKQNKDTKLANGNVSESVNDTPKSSKETAKIISKDLKPNLREIKLVGKETTKITRETARSVSRENLTRSLSRDNLTRSTSRENLAKSLSKENLRSTPRESLSRSTSKESLRNIDKERENLTRSLSRENLVRSTTRESLSRSTSKENIRNTDKDVTPDIIITPKFVSRKITPKFVSRNVTTKDTPKFTEVLKKNTPKSTTKVEISKDTQQSGSKDDPSLDTLKSVSKDINSVSISKEDYPKDDQKSVKEASLQEFAKSVPKEVTQKDVKKPISKDVSLIGTIKSVSKDSPKVSTKIIQKSSLNSTNKSNLRNVKPLTKSNSNKKTLKNSQLKGPMKALFNNKPPTLKVGTQKIGAPKPVLKIKKHGIGKSIIRSLKKSLKRSAVTKELLSINEHIDGKVSITKKAGEKKRRNSEKVMLKKVEQNASEKKSEKVAEKECVSLDLSKKNIEDGSTAVKKSTIKTNEKSNSKSLEKKTSIPMIVNPDLDESIQLASDTWESGLAGRRRRGRPAKRKAEIEMEAQQNFSMGKSVAKANSAASHEGKKTTTFAVDVHNSMSGEPQITIAGVHGAQVGKKRRVVSPAKPSTKTMQVEEKHDSDVPIPKDSSSTNSSSASNTKILPVRSTRERSTKNSDATDNTNASVPRLELFNSSTELQHDLKDTPVTSKTPAQTLVTQTFTPKSSLMQKFKSITPIFVPRNSPKTLPITPVVSNTSKIINVAPKPSTKSPQIVPNVGPISPNVPIVSKEIPVSNIPNVSVASPVNPLLTSAPSIISVPSYSNSSMVTSHSTSDSVTTTTSLITSTVVTSQASTNKGKPLTFVPISISPKITKTIPSISQNTISISKPIPQKDINEKIIISPSNKSLVRKAISLEDISQLQTNSVQKSLSLKDLSKHSNAITEKSNSNIPSTSVSNVSSPVNKSSPRKKPNLLTIADTLMAKKLPAQMPYLEMGLSKGKSAVDEIKEKAALAKKEFGYNKTPMRKTVTNIVDQEKRNLTPSPSMPSLEKVTYVNMESSPVDIMPHLDRMKDSPLRELSITPLPKQTSAESAKTTKSYLRPTVETHTLTVSVAKVSSISPDSESNKDLSKLSKKKVPRVLKQLYLDEGVQNMLSSLGEGGLTEKESQEMGPHKLRPKKATDPNIGAILDSDIDELILMHNQQTMMNKKKKRSNEVESLYKDEGIVNLLTNLETSSKRSGGQFEDSESDISSTSGKSARQAKTISSEVSVTETKKRRLSGTSSVSTASSGSMKPPDTKKAKLIGRESSEFVDLEEIEESGTSSKEEATQKRSRGRPSLPEHVKQKNKAMKMQLQLQKEGRDVTVSRLEENGSANTIPQIEFIRLPKDNKKTKVDSGSSPNMQGSQYIPPVKIRLPSGETSFTPPQQGSSTGTLQGVSRSVTITPINSNNSVSRSVSPAPQQQSQAETHIINNKVSPHGSKVLPGQLVRRPGSPDKLQQQMPQGKRVEIAASPTAASYANLVNSLIPGIPAQVKKREGGETLRQSQRASVRQSEGNYRYRDISLRKFNNFVQIILTPSTTKMKNALNSRVLRELVEALNTLKRDDTVRLVLFTATGSTFCQGVDLTALMHNNQEIRKKNAENLVKGIKDFLKALVSFHKPIVAGVNGNAMGLGVTMLPLFDLVIATDKAEFFLPYSKLGQVPEGGSTYTFPSILGKLQSTRLFMGHKVSAAEACSMGLASESIWPATFQRELLPKVALIAQNSSQSMEATKALMNHHLLTKLELSLESECRLLLQHWLTPQFNMLCKRFLDSQLGILHMQKPVNLPL